MVKQLSVFIQNRAGKIASIVKALADAKVDIRAISIADTTDFGILRMLVDDIEIAKTTLSNQNCIISVNEVTLIAVPDEPGGLSGILELMAGEGIDIEYMYSLIQRGNDKAYMVIRVSDEAKLLEMMKKNGMETVSASKLGIR